ncbi:dTDP-4-dehydrorhamnose 3,5-epimerase [Rhizobium sp. CNPSo 4039]|uniref:dTDP-4-dehydrorhamnose 3,5-epimerase n=1 Tax=Rhizobium sp. CNPSo 4039 TaxID=3021409 RepID=UPI00254E7833|nr:dTDP-4-dehydrorhamnose 3,5-epimerase [Rhizobium sp. CNPSo 4039]MDK4713650.1 dTDP-4-dehydrorhamnose 3,5-epimerase [Rhizobium sp. CNPSo 4039]
MKAIDTVIPDVKIIEPTVFADDRGFFFESFSKAKFEAAIGRSADFVQDNHSRSGRGGLRGLHYQLPPHAQAKLVRVVAGEVYDVAVDIRKSSPTFGQWVGVLLTAENKRQLWIPEGFAHGFLTLSEQVEFLYKTTNYYAPESDRGIRWDDPQIGIDWKVTEPLTLSSKDQQQPLLADAELFD